MKKLLFIFMLLPLNLMAQYNWQALPNAPKSWRCDDVYFLTPKMGWVVSPYYTDSCWGTHGKWGQIWKTRDGGNTWQLLKDSSAIYYRSIGFADSLHGWMGNLADTRMFPCGRSTPDTVALYYTNDGGNTWAPVTGIPSPAPKGICGISVVNDSVVYAYGRFFGPPVLVKTMDRGKTWTSTDMSPYASVGLIDGWFWNQDTGFITGQDGANAVILHTVDGGATWQTVYHASRGDSDHVWKLSFPSRDTGYGSLECLYYGRHKRYFVKTVDGGKTWTEYPFISGYDEEGCGFINDSIGWIGGDNCAPTYITFDGGKNWQADNGFGVTTPPYQYCSDGFTINRFRRFGDTLMYASGNTVYKLSGKLTGVTELHKPFITTSCYPSPFKKQTTISYCLTQSCSKVLIEIYSTTGQKVFSVNAGLQMPGEHTYLFNKPLPPGVYFYKIIAGKLQATGKLVKINQ